MIKFKHKSKYYVLLLFSIFLYSFTGIFAKLASKQRFLSFNYIILYLCIIIILGLYAMCWQIVLKNIDLSVAMAFKPLALVFSILWAQLIFNEYVSKRMYIGFAMIIIGILITNIKNE